VVSQYLRRRWSTLPTVVSTVGHGADADDLPDGAQRLLP